MDAGNNDETIAQFAHALFVRAQASKETTQTLQAAERLMQVYRDSDDFRRFVAHPRFEQESVKRVLDALDKKLTFGTVLRQHLALLAQTRNLALFPKVFALLQARVAEEQGEVKAHVVSAIALSAAEKRSVEEALAGRLASEKTSDKAMKESLQKPLQKPSKEHLSLSFSEDGSLLSGLVITMRSRMIDLSLRSELRRLRKQLSLDDQAAGQAAGQVS